jgi:hypothetical protein
MFTPVGNSQLSPSANAAVTGLHAKQASAVLANLFASHNYKLKRDGVLIASNAGTGVIAMAEDVVITGTATRPNGAVAADVLNGMWTVEISSASDPLVFVTGEVSRLGNDGYVTANVIGPTDTVEYDIAVSSLSPVPVGVQDIELGPNKYSGVGYKSFTYGFDATPGAIVTSVPCRLRNVTGRWSQFVWAGVAGWSISKNGGVFVALDAANPTIPIAEGDIFQFQRIAPAAGYGQTLTVFATGQAGGASTAYPLLNWYINVVGATRAPQTFVIDGALGQEADAAFHANLVMGDIVQFKPGYVYKGWVATVSGVIYETLSNATQRAVIDGRGLDQNFGFAIAASPPYNAGKFLIFGNKFVYGIKLRYLEIRGGTVPSASSGIETIGTRMLGCDWEISDCYITDWSMGNLMGDYHTGGLKFFRNFVARCGRLSVYNGHSLYLNNSPQAMPQKVNIVEDNVFLDGSAQLVAHRTKSMVVRNNWMVSNQDQPDGSEGTGIGSGKGGQTCVNGGGPEAEDALVYAESGTGLQHSSVQIYGNVMICGPSTTPLGFGADSAGLLDFSNSIFVHNTVLLPVAFSEYSSVARFNQSAHSALLQNNFVAMIGGGNKGFQNWLLEMNTNDFKGKTAYFSINNSIPATAAYGISIDVVNEFGTVYNSSPQLTNQNFGTVNATPLAGAGVIGAALPLTNIPVVCKQNKHMPAIDLTRRTWAVMPTEAYVAAGGKLIPPPPQAINTNIGAL